MHKTCRRLQLGDRSGVAAPHFYNSLLAALRNDIISLPLFKRYLKTSLFEYGYGAMTVVCERSVYKYSYLLTYSVCCTVL